MASDGICVQTGDVWLVFSYEAQNWHRTIVWPAWTGQWLRAWHAPHMKPSCSVTAPLCCLWALPLGCWAHCHSNCCRTDLSCTSLKLIASHSTHFTNMCSNYYFARVIIKWESIGNKRGEMANIPGIATSALIMTETDWPSFGRLCPNPVIWKEETIRLLLAALNLPNKHADPDESVIKHIINMETAFSLGLAKISSTSQSSESDVCSPRASPPPNLIPI